MVVFMNLLYLKYAVEIEKYGTINKAAQNLFISQPHLSTSLKTLEDFLGIKIFQRTKHGVIPTNEGREFLQYARTIVSQVEVMEDRYAKKRDSTVDIKVACVRSSNFALPFSRLAEEYRANKNLRLSLHEGGFFQIIDLVKKGEADIGFVLAGLNIRNVCQNLIKTNHLDYNYLTTIKPKILLSKENNVNDMSDLDDLSSYVYVAYEEFEDSLLNLSNEHQLINSQASEKIIFVNDRHTLFTLLSQKKMYTIGHKQPTEVEENFNIASINCPNDSYDLEVAYITKGDNVITADIEFLIGLIREHLEKNNSR